MNNAEKWQFLMHRCTSPQSWIDFGWYFTVTASLQRRVWYYGTGTSGSELFTNMYVTFVGRPGLGKGLVTRTVARLLKFHKLDLGAPIKTSTGEEKPSLFPCGADSTTFEALLDSLAERIGMISLGPGKKPYVHTSYCFCLEELDSLFKRKTEDVCAFLKNAYDCGEYDYVTRHQAKHHLRNLCLSLLSGTQPDFFEKAQNTGLFGEGFASRSIWLFENKKRFSRFHNTTLDPDQKQAELELCSHLKRLAVMYGEITYSQEVAAFLEDWDSKILSVSELSAPPRLQEFFSRMKVFVLKLAAAIHFSDNTTFDIPLETFQKAIKILTAIIPALEAGLGIAGRNPIAAFPEKILGVIRASSPIAEANLIPMFYPDLGLEEIKEILQMLEDSRRIRTQIDSVKHQRLYYIV